MSTVIWKFLLPLADATEVVMPEGAEVLHVGVQREQVWLWARVDPDQPVKARYFRVAGTGHDLQESYFERLSYVGTFQLHDGVLVFHVFEIKP